MALQQRQLADFAAAGRVRIVAAGWLTGAVPSLLSALGNLLPLEVTGRAVKEAA